MKKMLGKRFMFLVALLVGLCIPLMAQTSKSVEMAFDDEGFYKSGALSGNFDGLISYSTNGSKECDDYLIFKTNYRIRLGNGQNFTIEVLEGSNTVISGVELTMTNSNKGNTWGISVNKEDGTVLNSSQSCDSNNKITVSQEGTKVTLTAGSTAYVTHMKVTYKVITTEEPTLTLNSFEGTTLTKGQVTLIQPTTNSPGAVTYTSSNTAVAAVNTGGVVATLSAGNVTITATVEAAGKYVSKQATIDLQVVEPSVDPNAWDADDLLTIQGLSINELDGNGNTKYYLKNVGTGLNVCYGGEWGTHCVESQSAHPIVLEDNGDGSYAIASLAGYLESNTLWFDFPKVCPAKDAEGYEAKFDPWEEGATMSKWRFEEVDGYEGQYYLVGDNDRVLTSVGDRSGLLVLKPNEKSKAYQRWVITTGADIRDNLMPNASATLPIDVSLAIRGGSFDLVDEEDVTANTPDAFKEMMPYLSKYWAGYSTDKTWQWDRTVRSWNPELYNCCAILNCDNNRSTSAKYTMTLPAGAYRFTFEGFYRREDNNNQDAYVKLSDDEGNVLGEVKLPKHDSSKDTGVSYAETGDYSAYAYGVNKTAASIFRDNDNYQHEISFYLAKEVQVTIDAYSSDGGLISRPFLIYLDNFCLYYTGFPAVAPSYISEPVDWSWDGYTSWLIWDSETQSQVLYTNATDVEYLAAMAGLDESQIRFVETDKVKEMKKEAEAEYAVYDALVTAATPIINAALNAADDALIYKNYSNANINAYKELFKDNNTALSKFEAKLNEFGVNTDKIDSRASYYDVIAKIELAYAYALAESEKNKDVEGADDHVDFSGAIFNHTFDLFTRGTDGKNKPNGWTFEDEEDTQVAINSHGTYNTSGIDGLYLFNTWGRNAINQDNFGGSPIEQTVTDLPKGTYLLTALMTSDANNYLHIFAEDADRTFKVEHDKTVFDDYGLRFEIGDDGEAHLGVAGAKDDGTCTMDAEGRWYKCDNFRLEYLPDGVLTLKEAAEKITNIDDSFHGVKVERSKMSTTKWSTFVVPFSMAVPSDWEVMEITGAEARPFVDGDGNEYEDLNLKFKSVSSIEAGKPYMVRLKAEASEGTIRVIHKNGQTIMDKTNVATTPNVDVKTRAFANPVIQLSGNGFDYKVEFIGSYTQCTIPNSLDADGNKTDVNYYFVSNNKFYRSTGNGNVMKGFRGYFKVTQTAQANNTNTNARGLRSLAMTRTETDIENVVDNEEVTVVAIYNVNGVKLESMQPGINILLMNNGTTKKVVVK